MVFQDARAAVAMVSKDFLPLSVLRFFLAPALDTKDSPIRTVMVGEAIESNVTNPPVPGPATVVSVGAAAFGARPTLPFFCCAATVLGALTFCRSILGAEPPVSDALFGVTEPFFQVPKDAKGWSNSARKYSRYRSPAPQNRPLVTHPSMKL